MLKNLQSTLPLWVDNRFYIRELTTYLHFISPLWVDSLSLSLNLSAAKMSCWKEIFPQSELTFPCFYSKANPWIVLSHYDRSQNITFKNLLCIQSSSILKSIFIYNISRYCLKIHWNIQNVSCNINTPASKSFVKDWDDGCDIIFYPDSKPAFCCLRCHPCLLVRLLWSFWFSCLLLQKKIQPVLKCA